ncbi:MAG: bifunctional (p)ppGpp synthetase/guanosine-3',5'-bis(diphosphate) 3'-pyrophosphohydrolase [Actinomycetia bacterium]|nr:bifunctional (p)ppGpp synthetase/guanosine-3',5'-bis(diphosphate) 3'-pyrophosphohydrolase [Actinomycetes bacterium]
MRNKLQKLENIINKVKKYNPGVDYQLIEKSFKLADKKHDGQFRKSGDPFIFHPLGVADIVTDMKLDTISIVCSILHDVIEDTDVELSHVKKEFGKSAAIIIDGLTKINKISFKTVEEEQAENLRKMIIAMSEDIRIILIKLADRLHNMRTLNALSPERQKIKAKETLDIFVPLAHRLGMSQLEGELEDLSFRYLYPKKFNEIVHLVEQKQKERETQINKTIDILNDKLRNFKIKAEITGRAKNFYSVYMKITKRGVIFDEIYDLTAVRVIVDDLKDCYGTLGIIHSLWKPIPGKFKDYIANPKFNLYQSLHTSVIGPGGKPIEIQIRTWSMHKTAEYGIAAHWKYKEGKIKDDKEFEERISWLREMLQWQKELSDPKDFMESLRLDLFHDEVFVFTPKGDVVRLPLGSTPIDFAYHIHTDVGHSCIGAMVNNRMVSLERPLRSGDIVEILTSKTIGKPSRDWLNIVKTARAKSKIKQWFRRREREEDRTTGRDLLSKNLRKQGLSLQSVGQYILSEISQKFGFENIDTLLAQIGAGKLSAYQVTTKIINAISKSVELEEETIKPEEIIKEEVERGYTKSVVVSGMEDLLIRLSRCCNPVPGDDIIGYITRGRGISVHRTDCPNIQNLSQDAERFIEVMWDLTKPSLFKVEIGIDAIDRINLLRDITEVISDYNLNITNIAVKRKESENEVTIRLILEIGDVILLNKLLDDIKNIDSIYDSYRTTPRIDR